MHSVFQKTPNRHGSLASGSVVGVASLHCQHWFPRRTDHSASVHQPASISLSGCSLTKVASQSSDIIDYHTARLTRNSPPSHRDSVSLFTRLAKAQAFMWIDLFNGIWTAGDQHSSLWPPLLLPNKCPITRPSMLTPAQIRVSLPPPLTVSGLACHATYTAADLAC